MAKNISRKEFLKATAMSAAGIGLLGAGVLNAKAEEEKPVHKNSSKWVLDSQNVKWDEEHDIVICGYGMAGTAAYIEAYEIDHNVDAVIYDKSDEENAGGHSHHSFRQFLPGTSTAMWLNQLSFFAPCQCFTFAGIMMTLPSCRLTASLPSS